MSEDFHKDIAVKLTMVLRDLHGSVPRLVEQACDEHGVEIDWAGAPEEEGGTVIGPG
jgi:hypothetical protein